MVLPPLSGTRHHISGAPWGLREPVEPQMGPSLRAIEPYAVGAVLLVVLSILVLGMIALTSPNLWVMIVHLSQPDAGLP